MVPAKQGEPFQLAFAPGWLHARRMSSPLLRPDGRAYDVLRPVSFQPGIAPAAAGSVLVSMGRTQVICAVSVEEEVPRWMKQQKVPGGWLTAEYSMLPYANADRGKREVTQGKVGGRTQEIQRLIGRSLRAVVDLEALGSRTVWVDCDVLQADGGTRTASVTGAWLALSMAVDGLLAKGLLTRDPVLDAVAAVSVGWLAGRPLLDLCYEEDFAADTDMNVVMTGRADFVEVQGTAEAAPFSRPELDAMLEVAGRGIRQLTEGQRQLLASRA